MMQKRAKKIYCCGCKKGVSVDLVDGTVIYPHRKDLAKLPFWQCRKCKCYVGCHYKTKNPTRELGSIPTQEIRGARSHVHSILDPLWKDDDFKRGQLYKYIAKKMFVNEFHTAEIRTAADAREAYFINSSCSLLVSFRVSWAIIKFRKE